MVKFLKPNKAVILLQGRFAGRKAVIVRSFDDGTRDRPYGHCLVSGISKYPAKVIKKDSAKKTAKNSRVKAFMKVVNYSHLIPTRYTLDVDLKDVVSPDSLVTKDKKVTAAKEIKKRFEERFKTGRTDGSFPSSGHLYQRWESLKGKGNLAKVEEFDRQDRLAASVFDVRKFKLLDVIPERKAFELVVVVVKHDDLVRTPLDELVVVDMLSWLVDR
ncbi:hypothetical protein GH714_001416 [Hevea brasiliensis]|uniref:60S ribosomal protein L27 n=1 Tax=Hevea brasiliensis TaxID=3981 RepID=A0A6A6M9Y6_HEVBR|nr:hypothetical protein GH714_001416 [Hevea brasiliensis]